MSTNVTSVSLPWVSPQAVATSGETQEVPIVSKDEKKKSEWFNIIVF